MCMLTATVVNNVNKSMQHVTTGGRFHAYAPEYHFGCVAIYWPFFFAESQGSQGARSV